jgi:hypothetical protein
MSPAQYENVRVGSVQWLLDGDQQSPPDESDLPVQTERVETVPGARRWPTRVALAALAVVVIGAGVVFALPEMRSRFLGSKSETTSVPPKTAPVAETGQPAAPASHAQTVAEALPPPPPPAQVAVSQPAPLPQPAPAALPKTALPPLAAATLPEPVHAAPPPPAAMALPAQIPAQPAQSAPAAAGPMSPVLPVASLGAASEPAGPGASPKIPASGSPDAQPAPIVAPAVPTAPAAQAPASPAPVAAAAVPRGAAAPVAEPVRVRLSFTAEESKTGEAFARQLRQEGYTVTSTVIHGSAGRWPGVAYFFRSDRETARLIARQLTAITGRTERARMSPRRPYPRPGTVEVSLLRYAKSGGTTGKRAHRLSLTHTHASHEEL